MFIAKVNTRICNQEQLAELQKLGCDKEPFITRSHELIFKATLEDETKVAALRALPFVTWVGPMPTYSY